MIDKQGFRHNVGIILLNPANQVFWGRRLGKFDAWQFPQGGILEAEDLKHAMFRELHEELGLLPNQVKVLGNTKHWLRYYIPARLRSRAYESICVGQKQKWFLLKLTGTDTDISLDHSAKPEFTQWRWVDYWYPLEHIVAFKKNVYRKALSEFEPIVFETASSFYKP